MFRKLRVLAAFFMVPLVVFSNPPTAAAANSELVTIAFGDGGTGPWAEYLDTDCHFGMAISSVGLVTVGTDSYCFGGADITPGHCGHFEAGCSIFEMDINDVNGESCGTIYFQDPTSGDRDGITTLHTMLGGGSVSIGLCDPVSVCLTVDTAVTLGGDSVVTECSGVDLDGAVDPVGTACPATNGQNVGVLGISQFEVIPASGQYRVRVKVEAMIPGPASGQPSETWELYMVGVNMQGTSTTATILGDLELWTAPTVTVAAGTTVNAIMVSDSGIMSLGAANEFAANTIVKGVGMYSPMPGDNSTSLKAAPRPVNLSPQGMYGISNPARCGYYWGEKIAEYGAPSPYDEPIAPVVGSPTGPVEPVPDPTTPPPADEVPEDEPGFWGAILAALKSIWAAITSVGSKVAALAGKIVSGITGAFSGLFVPDDGYLESRYNSIESKWEDTSPAKYADAVSGFTVGSASGCGGLPLSLTLPGDVQVNQNIGAACSGTMATTAGIVRLVLSASFVIGGLFACVRAIGSGLGWDPGVGRGAGA